MSSASDCKSLRAFVSKAGGFIGSHVVEALVSSGVQGKALAAHFQTIEGIEVRCLRRAECHLSKYREEFLLVLRSFRLTTVFHLAGRVRGSEPELDRDNRLATANLLEGVRLDFFAAKIVLRSAVGVYRDVGTADATLRESQPQVRADPMPLASTPLNNSLSPMPQPGG